MKAPYAPPRRGSLEEGTAFALLSGANSAQVAICAMTFFNQLK
jgi:hypothetical protein